MPSLQKYARALPYTYAPGIFPALEALKKKPEDVQRVLLSSARADSVGIDQILRLCEKQHIRTEEADKALRQISGKENCFAAAVVKKRQDTLLRDTCHLVLHQPGDKGNLGTILRSALGFGFLDIALIPPACDLWDPHVVRASMGAVFSLRVQEYGHFEAYQAAFPDHHVYPFMLNGSKTLSEALKSVQRPFTLVMGNEGSGLPASFQTVGTPVRIDHSSEIDSLNLAVATAIGMYAFSHAS